MMPVVYFAYRPCWHAQTMGKAKERLEGAKKICRVQRGLRVCVCFVCSLHRRFLPPFSPFVLRRQPPPMMVCGMYTQAQPVCAFACVCVSLSPCFAVRVCMTGDRDKKREREDPILCAGLCGSLRPSDFPCLSFPSFHSLPHDSPPSRVHSFTCSFFSPSHPAALFFVSANCAGLGSFDLPTFICMARPSLPLRSFPPFFCVFVFSIGCFALRLPDDKGGRGDAAK